MGPLRYPIDGMIVFKNVTPVVCGYEIPDNPMDKWNVAKLIRSSLLKSINRRLYNMDVVDCVTKADLVVDCEKNVVYFEIEGFKNHLDYREFKLIKGHYNWGKGTITYRVVKSKKTLLSQTSVSWDGEG